MQQRVEVGEGERDRKQQCADKQHAADDARGLARHTAWRVAGVAVGNHSTPRAINVACLAHCQKAAPTGPANFVESVTHCNASA